MTSAEIRQSFLDFFKEKQHTIVPSSSLMPDSPNLLFTNAGMNQFVPIFLAEKACPYKPARAADTQKCIRAGGKHNDLEDVGLDTYHHTFFEMLGNWSFGDYFKKEAIEWAWELVVERWKFPANRLYATVYSPDKSKGDPSEFDQEAHDIWAALFKKAGLDPKVHIVNGNKKDNFWMMGDTGPCGPCSELHVDLTPDGDTKGSLVNSGDARCIEIWNLVFIQFNANPDGTFSPLPARHVDTGMGFERVCSIIQGTKNFSDFKNARISNYETDVFEPIFRELEKISGRTYGNTLPRAGSTGDTKQERIDVFYRVIADHIRTLTFAISDDILPGNDERNYVIRKILRRAMAFVYEQAGSTTILHRLVPTVVSAFRNAFPNLAAKQDRIAEIIETEEHAFLKNLESGMSILNEAISISRKDERPIPGQLAFKLHDTYGFPLDLTQLKARECGVTVDACGFDHLMEQQRNRARAARKKTIISTVADFADERATEFVGYDILEVKTELGKIRGGDGFFIFKKTPFYAEMGGQVGDSGTATFIKSDGTQKIVKIANTTKVGAGIYLHHPSEDETNLVLPMGSDLNVTLTVDKNRRAAIQSHHSVTHLLHWALHEVVSRDISQKGSFVSGEKLTFDFNSAALTPEQTRKVEELVNQRILENAPVSWTEVKHADIKGRNDIMQFFGDKYGEVVRVVQIGGTPGKLDGYSMELCGGTHVRNTAEIGPFRIVSEGAIAAGVRRIEAVSGGAIHNYLEPAFAKQSEELAALLQKSGKTLKLAGLASDPIESWKNFLNNQSAVENLKSEIREFEKEQAKDKQAGLQRRLSSEVPAWIAKAETINGISLLTHDIGEADAAILPLAVGELKKSWKGVAVLAFHSGGRVGLIASVSPDLVSKIQAGNIIKEIAPLVGGKGGGKPDLAQGGGTQPENISAALAKVKTLL
ncbi:MAG: alanine--tRNA ligase [Methylacidiphilales bacterium]|nr:alanine--tRNA ligase [Candidatus Methylacidiphilales bacterium]